MCMERDRAACRDAQHRNPPSSVVVAYRRGTTPSSSFPAHHFRHPQRDEVAAARKRCNGAGIQRREIHPCHLCNQRRSRCVAKAQRECMIAHISRPAGDPFPKTRTIVCEQRSRRFFEAGQIAGQRRHEVVGALL